MRLARQGTATVPTPLAIHANPTEAQEWRLVTVRGRIDTVRKLGDRWRAELRVGAASVVVIGQAGAAIPVERLIEGRLATVVGIVRRPYPTATDRRFAVLPRDRSDVHVDAASAAAGVGSAAAGRPTTGTSSTAPAAGASPTAAAAAFPSAPDVDIRDLAAAIGRTVRIGGLVVDLQSGGFRLDDGTAIGSVQVRGTAVDLLDLVEVGDAINVSGRVDRSAAGPVVIVEDASAIAMTGTTTPAGTAPASAFAVAVGAAGRHDHRRRHPPFGGPHPVPRERTVRRRRHRRAGRAFARLAGRDARPSAVPKPAAGDPGGASSGVLRGHRRDTQDGPGRRVVVGDAAVTHG